MRAGELMRTDAVTFRPSDPVEEALDVLVAEHVHGAPVVDERGRLVGVISQLDIHFGRMTAARRAGEVPGAAPAEPLRVGDVMTAPAVSATEETDVLDLCRLMYRLRIHRVPIVRDGAVRGIVSSLDVCRALATGRLPVADRAEDGA